MEQITQPSTTTILETSSRGSFAIEPLFPGYGSTLGNAMRRVLLSSLEGAAVDFVTIDGVQHEFTTIPHVKEDVVEIILSLKKLRFKMNVDQAELEMNVTKAGEITAADFKKNTDCEVVNTDQHIATLDKGGSFSMRISVKKGQGYEPVEKKITREKTVGVIAIDSIYSPVQAVSYKVENTRVGQMTNFDKLIIDVQTDGSIMPSVALNEAAQILTAQYQAISGNPVIAAAPVSDEVEVELTSTEEIIVSDDSLEILHSLDAKTKIEDAGFSGRTTHALTAAGYKTLSGLKRLSDIKLQSIKGLGTKGVEEVKAVLSRVE